MNKKLAVIIIAVMLGAIASLVLATTLKSGSVGDVKTLYSESDTP
ncbi:MAG: hypothetical protein PVH29_08025 [Candidatus Zixiibacteriota bacterium]|jgi:hypothetical protein